MSEPALHPGWMNRAVSSELGFLNHIRLQCFYCQQVYSCLGTPFSTDSTTCESGTFWLAVCKVILTKHPAGPCRASNGAQGRAHCVMSPSGMSSSRSWMQLWPLRPCTGVGVKSSPQPGGCATAPSSWPPLASWSLSTMSRSKHLQVPLHHHDHKCVKPTGYMHALVLCGAFNWLHACSSTV